MARTLGLAARPAAGTNPRTEASHAKVGIAAALIGLMVVAVTAIGNLVIAGASPVLASQLAWPFGLGTTGLGVMKMGIAVVLIGIIIRLWYRVDSVRQALTDIVGDAARQSTSPTTISTDVGTATVSANPPPPLLIHRMARALWLPKLAMGAMALVIGLIVGLAASGQAADSSTFRELSAWAQGTLFLGEGLLLSGISLLLGTVLAGLREGGGEVQAALGAPVKTLAMPTSAKAFIALMAVGMMAAIGQFVGYAVVATQYAGNAAVFATNAAWLGPLREVALGVLLSGIVLALYTISRVLGFQFTRIRELITTAA